MPTNKYFDGRTVFIHKDNSNIFLSVHPMTNVWTVVEIEVTCDNQQQMIDFYIVFSLDSNLTSSNAH